MYQNVNFQEKRDREVRKALEREELSNEEIKELRSTIAPVEAKEVVVYESGDEDAHSDLLLKHKISLESPAGKQPGKINAGEVACWLYLGVIRHPVSKCLSKT